MARQGLLLFIRVCAVVLPLIAVHRFWIAEKPGYKDAEKSGLRGTPATQLEAVTSSAWRAQALVRELETVKAEADKLETELTALRLASPTRLK